MPSTRKLCRLGLEVLNTYVGMLQKWLKYQELVGSFNRIFFFFVPSGLKWSMYQECSFIHKWSALLLKRAKVLASLYFTSDKIL